MEDIISFRNLDSVPFYKFRGAACQSFSAILRSKAENLMFPCLYSFASCVQIQNRTRLFKDENVMYHHD